MTERERWQAIEEAAVELGAAKEAMRDGCAEAKAWLAASLMDRVNRAEADLRAALALPVETYRDAQRRIFVGDPAHKCGLSGCEKCYPPAPLSPSPPEAKP